MTEVKHDMAVWDERNSANTPGRLLVDPPRGAVTITDEMIDRAARALYDTFAHRPTDKLFANQINYWRNAARNALTAALVRGGDASLSGSLCK